MSAYNGLSWCAQTAFKENILILGVEGFEKIDHTISTTSQPYRDSIRTLSLECQFNVFTISEWKPRPNLGLWHRHLPIDFNRADMPLIVARIFGDVRFKFIVVDYFRSPRSWARTKWKFNKSILTLLAHDGTLILPNFQEPHQYNSLGATRITQIPAERNPLWMVNEKLNQIMPPQFNNITQTMELNPKFPFVEVRSIFFFFMTCDRSQHIRRCPSI